MAGFRRRRQQPIAYRGSTQFRRVRATAERFVDNVREPARAEPIEFGWRPVDPTVDLIEAAFFDDQPWPEDLTVLYYWRPTFWRRRAS